MDASLWEEIAASERAPDPNEPVTYANLFERELFWPHQIQLTADWKPVGWGEEPFGWGMGVLLRVDAEGRLRVDFSRFGKHWLPANVTDVLARANQLRVGADQKYAPNLVLALKNRLLDPTGEILQEIQEDVFEQRVWVLVFADPLAEGFEAIAASMAPISAQDGVQVTLIAQGKHLDSEISRACYRQGWKGTFLLDRFGPAYTEGYLDGDRPPPFIQVSTPEGRLIWEAAWSDDAARSLRRSLEPGVGASAL